MYGIAIRYFIETMPIEIIKPISFIIHFSGNSIKVSFILQNISQFISPFRFQYKVDFH